MAQAIKNLHVSHAQHQPPRVTRTGQILATIVAHFQCVAIHRISFPTFEYYLALNMCPNISKNSF